MDDRPLAPPHIKCHETGFKRKCMDLCLHCWKWVSMPVRNPETGVQKTEWMCADIANTRLLYNMAGEINGAGRATEEMRNAFYVALPEERRQELEKIEHRNRQTIEQS